MKMEQNKKYTYEDFLEIIKILRSENGCPWDREQTHESLKPCVMEEAAELVGSIRIYDKTGNAENMQEELGDLLLQVVMHSQIAEEEHLFTMDDVVEMVAEKMVRRHPHVFGNATADTSSEVLKNWDEIKKSEKEGKSWIESPLKEIPRELPSLSRSVKLLKKIDKLYEKRPNEEQVLEDMIKKLSVLQENANKDQKEDLKQVVGDVLLGLSDLCRINKLTPEQILTDRLEDLIEEYESKVDGK